MSSQHPQIDGELPDVRLEYVGMEPDMGEHWCSTCAILYMGAISNDEANIAECRKQVANARELEKSEAFFTLPIHPWYKLRQAITIAPSVLIPYPLPVCWVHISGRIPQAQMANQAANHPANNNLIAGKAYDVPNEER